MEIIIINDCKLKVMLGEEDLRQFEIKAEQLDYSNTETKRMFWDILNRAKHETGFDTDGQRVLVQLYPSKHGGCEMFVTKIGLLPSDCENAKPYYNKKHASNIPENKHCPQNISMQTVFYFDSMNTIIAACKRLKSIGYIGESSFYISDIGKKYLFLSDVHINDCSTLNELSFILEYASPEDSKKISDLVSEHGRYIFENNAVTRLANL